ncbi:unnamed protein product [Lactuca saligna]|uniref:Uncharacterized protein n=1 Tax=Lactuca saligna TaxID=75948 RepID=A0AA35ZW39_LACSI|nr:unnamed protein product [Lactuca saligna]
MVDVHQPLPLRRKAGIHCCRRRQTIEEHIMAAAAVVLSHAALPPFDSLFTTPPASSADNFAIASVVCWRRCCCGDVLPTVRYLSAVTLLQEFSTSSWGLYGRFLAKKLTTITTVRWWLPPFCRH